jgi:membrane associated rhomboid family serine protease
LIPLKDNIPTRKPALVTYVIIALNILVFIFFQQALFGKYGGFSSAGNPERVVHFTFIPYRLSHPGSKCGLKAEVEGPDVGTQVVNSPNGQPLCTGESETFETNFGGTERVTVRRVIDHNEPSVWLTIFIAMFMHGGVLHIAGNMLFLWIFGNNVEDAMGKLKFVGFYLAGGLVASLTQYLAKTGAAVPTLGASGAIAAVLGGYALLYPRARVITLIFIIFFVTVVELPALVVLGAWFLFQLIDASSQPLGGGGGVAYFAHIGGFLFGLLVIKLLATRYDPYYDRRGRTPVY